MLPQTRRNAGAAGREHMIETANMSSPPSRAVGVDRLNHAGPIIGKPFLSDPRDSVGTMPNQTRHQPATTPTDLGRFFVERANARDVDGRGSWLWAIDQPNVLG